MRWPIYLGFIAIAAGGALMNDYTKQTIRNPDANLTMASYSEQLQGRITRSLKEDVGPGLVALPATVKSFAVSVITPEEKPQKVQKTNRLADFRKRNSPSWMQPAAASGSMMGMGNRSAATEDLAKEMGEMMSNAQAGNF